LVRGEKGMTRAVRENIAKKEEPSLRREKVECENEVGKGGGKKRPLEGDFSDRG